MAKRAVKKRTTRKKVVRKPKPLPPGVYGFDIESGPSFRDLVKFGTVTGRIRAERPTDMNPPRKVVDMTKPPKTLKEANEIISNLKAQITRRQEDYAMLSRQHEVEKLESKLNHALARANYSEGLLDRVLNALNAKVTYSRLGDAEVGVK